MSTVGLVASSGSVPFPLCLRSHGRIALPEIKSDRRAWRVRSAAEIIQHQSNLDASSPGSLADSAAPHPYVTYKCHLRVPLDRLVRKRLRSWYCKNESDSPMFIQYVICLQATRCTSVRCTSVWPRLHRKERVVNFQGNNE